MDQPFQDYFNLATRNEDLKSVERVLTLALDNQKQIKNLLIEKEREFCNDDQELREPSSCRSSLKDSLRKRCFRLIDHLVHYKCIIECLSGDILALESNILSDDEFIHLSLMFRDTELVIMQAIKTNQQRNEILLNIHDEEAQSYLSELEHKWRAEHLERRKVISKLMLDQNQLIVDKISRNLELQQSLLNDRYQCINNLIKISTLNMKNVNNIKIQ